MGSWLLPKSCDGLGELLLGFGQAQLAGDQAREQGVAQGGEGLGLLVIFSYRSQQWFDNYVKFSEHRRCRQNALQRSDGLWLYCRIGTTVCNVRKVFDTCFLCCSQIQIFRVFGDGGATGGQVE